MRRSAAIIILGLYAVLSIGIQLHLHYCCGRLAEVNLWAPGNCDHSHEESDHCKHELSCCSFQDLSFKLDDLHRGTSFRMAEPVQEMPIIAVHCPLVLHAETETKSADLTSHGPPIRREPIWIQYHQIIVYA